MAAIGSLVFCTDCGNLLDGSSGDKQAILTCEVCGAENKGTIQGVGVSSICFGLSHRDYFRRHLIYHNHNKIKVFSFPFSATV